MTTGYEVLQAIMQRSVRSDSDHRYAAMAIVLQRDMKFGSTEAFLDSVDKVAHWLKNGSSRDPGAEVPPGALSGNPGVGLRAGRFET